MDGTSENTIKAVQARRVYANLLTPQSSGERLSRALSWRLILIRAIVMPPVAHRFTPVESYQQEQIPWNWSDAVTASSASRSRSFSKILLLFRALVWFPAV